MATTTPIKATKRWHWRTIAYSILASLYALLSLIVGPRRYRPLSLAATSTRDTPDYQMAFRAQCHAGGCSDWHSVARHALATRRIKPGCCNCSSSSIFFSVRSLRCCASLIWVLILSSWVYYALVACH